VHVPGALKKSASRISLSAAYLRFFEVSGCLWALEWASLWALEWAYKATESHSLSLIVSEASFDSFRDIHLHIYGFLKWFVGVGVGVSNFF